MGEAGYAQPLPFSILRWAKRLVVLPLNQSIADHHQQHMSPTVNPSEQNVQGTALCECLPPTLSPSPFLPSSLTPFSHPSPDSFLLFVQREKQLPT